MCDPMAWCVTFPGSVTMRNCPRCQQKPRQDSVSFEKSVSVCSAWCRMDLPWNFIAGWGHSWIPGKRLIWLCYDRAEVEAQLVAIVPSQHGQSVSSEQPLAPFALTFMSLISCCSALTSHSQTHFPHSPTPTASPHACTEMHTVIQ